MSVAKRQKQDHAAHDAPNGLDAVSTGQSLRLLKKYGITPNQLRRPGARTMSEARSWVLTALKDNFGITVDTTTMTISCTTATELEAWSAFCSFMVAGIESRIFFAGMHCFGYACLEMLATLDFLGVSRAPDGICFEETCDINSYSQTVLLNYADTVRGRRITRDICEQLPTHVSDKLEELQWADDATADVVSQLQRDMKDVLQTYDAIPPHAEAFCLRS